MYCVYREREGGGVGVGGCDHYDIIQSPKLPSEQILKPKPTVITERYVYFPPSFCSDWAMIGGWEVINHRVYTWLGRWARGGVGYIFFGHADEDFYR